MPAAVTLRGGGWVLPVDVCPSIYGIGWHCKSSIYISTHTYIYYLLYRCAYLYKHSTGQTLAFSYTGHTKNPICQSTSCQVSIEAPLHLVQVQGLSKLLVLLDAHPLAIRRPRPPPPPVSPEMEHALGYIALCWLLFSLLRDLHTISIKDRSVVDRTCSTSSCRHSTKAHTVCSYLCQFLLLAVCGWLKCGGWIASITIGWM